MEKKKERRRLCQQHEVINRWPLTERIKDQGLTSFPAEFLTHRKYLAQDSQACFSDPANPWAWE